MALAAVQVHSGHDLRLLPHGALVTRYPEGYEWLVEDFFDAANSVALTSQADDIVNKVFSDLYLVISDISEQLLHLQWFSLHPSLCSYLPCSCRRYTLYWLLSFWVYLRTRSDILLVSAIRAGSWATWLSSVNPNVRVIFLQIFPIWLLCRILFSFQCFLSLNITRRTMLDPIRFLPIMWPYQLPCFWLSRVIHPQLSLESHCHWPS